MITIRTHTIAAAAAAAIALITALPTGAAGAVQTTAPSSGEIRADGPEACRIKTLHVPFGVVSAEVNAGDPSGHMLAGTATDTDGKDHVVLWENRVARLVASPTDGFMVKAVSTNGTIAGLTAGQGFVITPDGAYHNVAAHGEASATATGAVADGTVAGTVYHHATMDPAVWAPGSYDDPTILHLPDSLSGAVTGMAADGSIAVSTDFSPQQPVRAFVWTPDGKRRSLEGIAPGTEVYIDAIANGYAAGTEYDRDADIVTYLRWRLPSGRVTSTDVPADLQLSVSAVNRHGVIGGTSASGQPELLVGDHIVELPIPDGSSGAFVGAVASNGQAAGWASRDGGSIPVTWRCG